MNTELSSLGYAGGSGGGDEQGGEQLTSPREPVDEDITTAEAADGVLGENGAVVGTMEDQATANIKQEEVRRPSRPPHTIAFPLSLHTRSPACGALTHGMMGDGVGLELQGATQFMLCRDMSTSCEKWAREGECMTNKDWMLGNSQGFDGRCMKACGACDDSSGAAKIALKQGAEEERRLAGEQVSGTQAPSRSPAPPPLPPPRCCCLRVRTGRTRARRGCALLSVKWMNGGWGTQAARSAGWRRAHSRWARIPTHPGPSQPR